MQDSPFFTIMGDESADITNQEQVVICIRWIDELLEIHEDFIGMQSVARCTAEKIVKVLTVSSFFCNMLTSYALGFLPTHQFLFF